MAPSSMYTAPIDKGIHVSDYAALYSLVWPGARAQKLHLGPYVKNRHLETEENTWERDTRSSLTDIYWHIVTRSRFCLKSQST